MNPATLRKQDGSALIIALIFLVVLAMLGVAAAEVTILEERMAGNTRDRELAFQAAEAALKVADTEWDTGANYQGTIPNPPNTTSGTVYAPGLRAINLCLPNSAEFWSGGSVADCNGTSRTGPTWDNTDSIQLTVNSEIPSANQPRIIVDRLPNQGTSTRYRVTVRAQGKSAQTVVILQVLNTK